MQITSGEILAVQLEPVVPYDFHEKPIALQALGSFVATNRGSREVAGKAADLGCRLAIVRHTSEEGNKITTEPFTMSEDEAQLLGKALCDLIGSTEDDVRSYAQAGNLHGCSVRYVESSIASDMLAKLTAETSQVQDDTLANLKPGFMRPGA